MSSLNLQNPIVVVEDNEDDSYLLTRQLARAQIDDHITVFGNGEAALDFLLNTSQLPLVIFLDLHLPGLGGVELLQRLRREPRLHTVPVIIMTGSLDPGDIKECERLGVTTYLPKPISLTVFIKAVAHLFPKASDAETS